MVRGYLLFSDRPPRFAPKEESGRVRARGGMCPMPSLCLVQNIFEDGSCMEEGALQSHSIAQKMCCLVVCVAIVSNIWGQVHTNYVDVSWNRGTPKPSRWLHEINHPFLGTPIYGNLHVKNSWRGHVACVSCGWSNSLWPGTFDGGARRVQSHCLRRINRLGLKLLKSGSEWVYDRAMISKIVDVLPWQGKMPAL